MLDQRPNQGGASSHSLECGRSCRAQSSVSVATIRRAELTEEDTSMTAANDLAVRRALEAAGVEFIDENGGGPGVRLKKRKIRKPAQTDD